MVMAEKKLTSKERAQKFQEGYEKLCEEWKCRHVPFPRARREGKIILVDAGLEVMVKNDKG